MHHHSPIQNCFNHKITPISGWDITAQSWRVKKVTWSKFSWGLHSHSHSQSHSNIIFEWSYLFWTWTDFQKLNSFTVHHHPSIRTSFDLNYAPLDGGDIAPQSWRGVKKCSFLQKTYLFIALKLIQNIKHQINHHGTIMHHHSPLRNCFNYKITSISGWDIAAQSWRGTKNWHFFEITPIFIKR